MDIFSNAKFMMILLIVGVLTACITVVIIREMIEAIRGMYFADEWDELDD